MAYDPMAGGSYDYANAFQGGAMGKPLLGPTPPWAGGHLPSVDPSTGGLLKQPGHPTMWKEDLQSGNLRVPFRGQEFSIPSGMSGFTEIAQSPYMQSLMRRKRRRPGIEDMLRKREEQMAALGKALPKLQEFQQKMKIEDAERKAKKLKLDYLTKMSQSIAEKQQIQQAKESV